MNKTKKSKLKTFIDVIDKISILFLNIVLCANFFLEAIPNKLKIDRWYFSLGIMFLIFGITFSVKNFPIDNKKENGDDNDNI